MRFTEALLVPGLAARHFRMVENASLSMVTLYLQDCQCSVEDSAAAGPGTKPPPELTV